ncbi:MAG: phage holin family protein [Steroidobacteraceae bacterium]
MLDPETSLSLEAEIEDLSFAQDLRLLAEEARALAHAELTFQKTRAAYVGAEVRTITLFAALGAAFVFFALMALTVGFVIALGTVLGPWTAMVVATLVIGGIAAGLMLLARARMRRMRAVLADDGLRAGAA